MSNDTWQQFMLSEIDKQDLRYPRRMRQKDRDFIKKMRERINIGMNLSVGADDWLRDIYERMTEIKRIKW